MASVNEMTFQVSVINFVNSIYLSIFNLKLFDSLHEIYIVKFDPNYDVSG